MGTSATRSSGMRQRNFEPAADPVVSFVYREPSATKPAAITWKDVFEIVRLPVFAVLARLVPASRWQGLSEAIVRLARMPKARANKRLAAIAQGLGQPPDSVAVAEIEMERAAAFYETRLQFMRFYPFGQWSPRLDVQGLHHLEDAVKAGRGVILWVTSFQNSSLFAKMALWQAGVRVHHLSRPGHGFSETRFGMAVLNPLRTRIENRFLASRILIKDGDTKTPVETMNNFLARGEIISITVSTVEGRRFAMVPFLSGYLKLATGAPALSFASGAQLLPVFAVRTGPDTFRATIGAPLPKAGSKEDTIRAACAAYVNALRPFVLSFPGQWHGWRNLTRDRATDDSGPP
jgi:lauroyl/myristoyl acyltransferase